MNRVDTWTLAGVLVFVGIVFPLRAWWDFQHPENWSPGSADDPHVYLWAWTAIEQLCRELGWSVDERVGDHGIVLHFRDPLVNIRKVLVTCGESIACVATLLLRYQREGLLPLRQPA